jgi:hypothetical protein
MKGAGETWDWVPNGSDNDHCAAALVAAKNKKSAPVSAEINKPFFRMPATIK